MINAGEAAIQKENITASSVTRGPCCALDMGKMYRLVTSLQFDKYVINSRLIQPAAPSGITVTLIDPTANARVPYPLH